MLDAIRKFVARHMEPGPPAVDTSAAAPAQSPVHVAACALMLEIAHADGEFTAEERAHIEGALGRHFRLDEAVARELITLAEAERRQSVDHFQFTHLIAEQYDLGQKMVLAEILWGIILADGKVAEHEAYMVRKLANLLKLEPGYLAEARRAAKPQA